MLRTQGGASIKKTQVKTLSIKLITNIGSPFMLVCKPMVMQFNMMIIPMNISKRILSTKYRVLGYLRNKLKN